MKPLNTTCAGTAISCGLLAISPAQESVHTLDPLYVRAQSLTEPWSLTEHIVGSSHLRHTDAASLVRNLPGAAVVRNGSQTGILQIRGLTGQRVSVKVDGMTITPACPNHMDPPLHYANPATGDLLAMYAGTSPVTEGGDHIGGSLNVSRAQPVFADGDESLLRGALGASFIGSQDAVSLDANLTYAQGDMSFNYHGSAATADDLRFPGGKASATGYDIMHHEIVGAWRTAGGYVALDVGYTGTRDAGTPALPMDMISDDAWNFGLTQSETFEWGTVDSRIYLYDIEHLMDNYTLRPAPMPPNGMPMESPSTSRDYGWRTSFLLPKGDTTIRTGIDLHRNEFDSEQVAVMTGMRRDAFNDSTRGRAGVYVDWEQDWDEKWNTRVGLRSDVVSSNTKPVSNQILPPPGPMRDMVLNDQQTFNSSKRSFTDVLVDAMAAVSFDPDETSTIELAFGMKNRAPSMLERYLWTPGNASAGLADGRTYLGNLGLDPETSFEIGLGLEKRGEGWNVEVTPFYQIVNNYIQGMPINRMDKKGMPVLQYENLDRADLYGFEVAGGYDINEQFGIDGSVSYVRGKNKDNGDSLYRIAPLRGILDLNYQHEAWESHLEWVWSAAQNDVSSVQGEKPSPGYGILNFRLARTFAKRVRWELGVENIFDKRYADHLSGVNRVTGGDLAVGERVPGAGRFGYTSITWEF